MKTGNYHLHRISDTLESRERWIEVDTHGLTSGLLPIFDNILKFLSKTVIVSMFVLLYAGNKFCILWYCSTKISDLFHASQIPPFRRRASQ